MEPETGPSVGDRPRVTALADYGIDTRHGFLPAEDPPDTLPPYYAPWEQAGRDLGALLMTGRLRAAVEALPELTPDRLDGGPARERAMLLLCCLANAHVWSTDPPGRRLPAPLARPLHRLAGMLDRPPIVSHASIVLNNWRRLDRDRPLDLTNIDTQLTFLGGVDEKWFYLATVGVELAGAPGLPLLVGAQRAAADGDTARLTARLRELRGVLAEVLRAVLAVERWCDPYVFYHRVRPFLAGWDAPGVRFEGVPGPPLALAGGSAAQSSLIQAFDAGLDVPHPGALTAGFLTAMRRHMPAPHRRFLHDLAAGPSVRAVVARSRAEHPALVEAYDGALAALAELRAQHIGLTGRYIKRFERGAEAGRGTGGSDFVALLKQSREETRDRRLG